MGEIKRITILGAGLYSEALLEVMVSEEQRAKGVEVIATHRRPERRAEVSGKFGIQVLASNREACRDADMIIPLVRPEQMAALMEEVGPAIREDQIVATGAASIALSWYRRFLKTNCTLAWVFTPVFMGSGEGFIGMTFEPGTPAGQKEALREYWGGFGNEIMEVDEKTRDAFTILQSCSQFFLYPVVKAMLEYGRLAGLSKADAQAVSLSTFRCVARELEGIEVTPEKLEGILDYARVPGNMTWEGLKELEGQEVEEAYRKCLAAAERQSELNRSGL